MHRAYRAQPSNLRVDTEVTSKRWIVNIEAY